MPPLSLSHYCTNQWLYPNNNLRRDYFLEASSLESSYDSVMIANATQMVIAIGIVLHDHCHDGCIVSLIYYFLVLYVVLVTKNC